MYKRNEKQNKATQGEGEVQVLQVSNRTSQRWTTVTESIRIWFQCFGLLIVLRCYVLTNMVRVIKSKII